MQEACYALNYIVVKQHVMKPYSSITCNLIIKIVPEYLNTYSLLRICIVDIYHADLYFKIFPYINPENFNKADKFIFLSIILKNIQKKIHTCIAHVAGH